MTLVPITYIEIVEGPIRPKARIAGTRITVEEIVIMHVMNDSPIDWIVDNHDALDHAKVHAALVYYYDHKDEIEQGIQESERLIRENATLLRDLIAPDLQDTE